MKLFTSESVTIWHPDKICDQISDAILDACLEQDKNSRVAIECLITTNKLVIAGEITSLATVDYEAIARKVICDIGYDDDKKYFNWNTCEVEVLVHKQSPDIAQWVDIWGAGDQWIMFGYATNESPTLMPLSIHLAHKLTKKLQEFRESWEDYLLPDWKSQVTVEYDENNKVKRVDTVVISTQHTEDVKNETLREVIIANVIKPVCWEYMDDETKIYVNPTWRFVVWGPAGDTWLTWRKIIVDSYWGMWRHWGWAFSWKDPTKVDRSWAYIARNIAKSIVARGRCNDCEVQLWYAIWVAEPVSILIMWTWNEGHTQEEAEQFVRENYDLTPKWIIESLNLRNPIYRKTAENGHFWNPEFSWEQVR